jgi:hypothetical protein
MEKKCKLILKQVANYLRSFNPYENFNFACDLSINPTNPCCTREKGGFFNGFIYNLIF